MKRFLIEVPDDVTASDVVALDTTLVKNCREFTENIVKTLVEQSISPTASASFEPVQEPLNEDTVYDQCAELSRQLALLSKKKQTSRLK